MKGLRGIVNVACQDYVIVVVQVLAHLPPVRDFFLSGRHKLGYAKSSPLLSVFGDLVEEIWQEGFSPIRAEKFWVSLGNLYERYREAYQEQDASDFLADFLSYLQLELHSSSERSSSLPYCFQQEDTPANDHASLAHYPQQGFIDSMFLCQKRARSICTECSKVTCEYDTSYCCQLFPWAQDILARDKVFTFEDLFALLSSTPDRICHPCLENCALEESMRLWRTARYIIFTCRRWDSPKNQTPIDIPLTIELAEPIAGPECVHLQEYTKSASKKYNLVSIVDHLGVVGGGQHVAWIQHPTDKTWYEFCDHHPVSSEAVNLPKLCKNNKDAIIIVYERDACPSLTWICARIVSKIYSSTSLPSTLPDDLVQFIKRVKHY